MPAPFLHFAKHALTTLSGVRSAFLKKPFLFALLNGNICLLLVGFVLTVIAKVEIYSGLLEYLFLSFQRSFQDIVLYPGSIHELFFLIKADLIFFVALLSSYLMIKHFLSRSRWIDALCLPVSACYAFLAFANQKWVAESGMLLDFGTVIFGMQQLTDSMLVVKEYVTVGFLAAGCGFIIANILFFTYAQRDGHQYVNHKAKWMVAVSFVLSTTLLISFDAVKANDAAHFHTQVLRNAGSVHLQFIKDATAQPLKQIGHNSGKQSAIGEEIATLTKKPNLILIGLESVRFKSTPFAKAEGITDTAAMPFLESLAKEGVLFKNVRTPLPHTSKALAASLSGHAPIVSSYLGETELDFPLVGLPDYLKKFGYQSAYFQSPTGYFERRPALAANLGFDHFATVPELFPETEIIGYLNADDQLMIKPALDWAQQQTSPFLLTLFTSITHHPYMLPGEYTEEKWRAFQTSMGAAEKYSLYKKALEYSDQFLRQVIETLREQGLLENSIVVIFGDHGEGFGEKGNFAHSQNPYEEVLRVPVVLYGKDYIRPGQEIEGLYSSMDIVPTILRLFGASNIPGQIEGVDMFAPPPERKLFFSTWFDKSVSGVVDESGRKFIYDPRTELFEVYDLTTDPWEKKNLFLELQKAGFDFEAVKEEIIAWKVNNYDQGYDKDPNAVKKISGWQCKATGTGVCFYGDKPGHNYAPSIPEE